MAVQFDETGPLESEKAMTEFKATRGDREPTHPGIFLDEEVLPSLKLSKTEIAEKLGISRQTLYDILGGKAQVTPEMAVRFGKLFGNGPMLWITMQRNYDLWHAERNVDTSSIPTLKVA